MLILVVMTIVLVTVMMLLIIDDTAVDVTRMSRLRMMSTIINVVCAYLNNTVLQKGRNIHPCAKSTNKNVEACNTGE